MWPRVVEVDEPEAEARCFDEVPRVIHRQPDEVVLLHEAGDGRVSTAELVKAGQGCGLVRRRLATHDADGNGHVRLSGVPAGRGTYPAGVATVVERLARLVDSLPGSRVLVAFDGPDAAGKTTLARAVAERLSRPMVRASMDGWHNPRDVRLRRGAESPEGYYRDSFDLHALQRDLLTPFRSGASDVRTAHYDHQLEQAVHERQSVTPDAALLFDGVFLLRPELSTVWDLSVYLHVPEQVSLTRAVTRDQHLLGDEAAVRHRYARRYLPGQALYRDAAAPRQVADVLLDNSDWSDPVVLRWPDQL